MYGEYAYLEILRKLVDKLGRTPEELLQHGPQDVAAVNIGATMMEFDLSNGCIPILTTKRISFKNVVVELLWVLSGSSRLAFLHEHNVHFWDQWGAPEVAKQYGLEPGDVGPIYGPNWINWPTTDGGTHNQIAWLINGLRTNPEWRRWKVVAWNPERVSREASILSPCHGDFHCVMVDGKLELHHMQRSGDFFVGIPYNIAFYSILLRMICQVTGLPPGKLVQITSDTHMYVNHLDGAQLQLTREPKGFPKLELPEGVNDIFGFRYEDFKLVDYSYFPAIGTEVAL